MRLSVVCVLVAMLVFPVAAFADGKGKQCSTEALAGMWSFTLSDDRYDTHCEYRVFANGTFDAENDRCTIVDRYLEIAYPSDDPISVGTWSVVEEENGICRVNGLVESPTVGTLTTSAVASAERDSVLGYGTYLYGPFMATYRGIRLAK